MSKIDFKWLFKSLIIDPLRSAYYVGFFATDDLVLPIKQRYQKINWIKVGKFAKDGWFADPFIYDVTDDVVVLFVEELKYRTNKGHLTKLIIDRNDWSIKEKKTLLELPTHLSFPIYIQEKDKCYIYPENYQGGALKIYGYDENTSTLTYVKTLIDEPLYDTQIVNIDGVYYAFGVKWVTGEQGDNKALQIYRSNSLLGEYEHIQTIINNRCEERGAGLIFTDNKGRLIRPAQCCEGGYGKSVVLYHLQLVDGEFSETEISRIEPDSNAPNGSVLHTYNQKNGLCVIDGFRVLYPKSAKVYRFIKSLIKL